jgi:hypothetical protein
VFSQDQAVLYAKIATLVAVIAGWLFAMSAAFCGGLGCDSTRYLIGLLAILGLLVFSYASASNHDPDASVVAAALIPVVAIVVLVLPN